MSYTNQAWFSNLVLGKNTYDISIDEIGEIISGLDDLMWEGKFKEISEILDQGLKTDTSPMVAVTLLRKCFVVRGAVPNYQNYVDRAIANLSAAGEDAKDILHGLY